jgi:uncharacterized membrane protein
MTTTRRSRRVEALWRMSARRRTYVVAAVGGMAGFVAAWFTPWQLSTLTAWNVAAAFFIIWVWASVGPFSPEETRAFATREDDSRWSAQLLLVSASVASLVGVALALLKASDVTGSHKISYIVAAVLTVVLSWAVVHTVYTLRYAHEYYTAPIGGIAFHAEGEYAPNYVDFAYVAFGIGMTFQIADTDIQRHEIRRSVLGHSLLAYLFGAVILAVTINLVASLLQ